MLGRIMTPKDVHILFLEPLIMLYYTKELLRLQLELQGDYLVLSGGRGEVQSNHKSL